MPSIATIIRWIGGRLLGTCSLLIREFGVYAFSFSIRFKLLYLIILDLASIVIWACKMCACIGVLMYVDQCDHGC